MPAIQISQLTQCYGSVPVLQGLELQLESFERLALLGPSGAGKSTLLRVLAGLETPSSGSITVDGEDISLLAPDRRRLALMSQDYALYPQLSVRRNLETALLSLRLAREESELRCNDVLQRFHIQQLSEQLPSQLSGGQAQRVALAKALIRRPRLLLLDEPFSQLDGPLRDELRDLLCEAVEHYHIPLIFVTHDPLDAMRLATHVAILHAGKIEQLNSPSKIYQTPVSRSAAELMSPWGMNWLTAECAQRLGSGPAVQALLESLAAGRQVGFRPEHTRLEAVDVANEDSLHIPVTVERSAFLGFAHLLHVKATHASFRCLVVEPSAVGERRIMIVPKIACVHV